MVKMHPAHLFSNGTNNWSKIVKKDKNMCLFLKGAFSTQKYLVFVMTSGNKALGILFWGVVLAGTSKDF